MHNTTKYNFLLKNKKKERIFLFFFFIKNHLLLKFFILKELLDKFLLLHYSTKCEKSVASESDTCHALARSSPLTSLNIN